MRLAITARVLTSLGAVITLVTIVGAGRKWW